MKKYTVLTLCLLLVFAFSSGVIAQDGEDAASIAVEAAQQYSGSTITILYEAGLQATDGYAIGPVWEELTGIHVNVIEAPFEELYNQMLSEHFAGTGSIDIYNLPPVWMGDLVAAGALEPLDPFLEQYYPENELMDINPTYRENWMQVGGVTYGIPDDGDYHMLYYRKDIFEDPDNQAEFMEAHGYELAPPETFEQFNEICAFISEKYAPETYGCAIQRVGQTDAWFMSVFRGLGGRFFDPDTMEAQINNEIGVQAATLLAESLEYGPPAQSEMDFVQVFSAFVSGDAAMVISWPPVGRWSQGVGVDEEGLAWLPETQIAGNIGYAPQPGGGELAAGMTLTISADSQNKEAAYLFAQWMNSQSVSLGRVISPTGLRDPFRESHYTSEEYLATWDNADEYLGALKAGQLAGYLDLSIPGSREFQVAVDQAMTTIYAGGDIQAALDQAAADWNSINEEKGIDSQREAYLDWAARPNAYGGE